MFNEITNASGIIIVMKVYKSGHADLLISRDLHAVGVVLVFGAGEAR